MALENSDTVGIISISKLASSQNKVIGTQ